MARIPVFVSCPSVLNADQAAVRTALYAELEAFHLEPRTLGRSDFPTVGPLTEVLVLARHCSGGLILGFSQLIVRDGIAKAGTAEEAQVDDGSGLCAPTPWNQLEAGVLFSLGLPLLVFREDGVQGGVFDPGLTDVFVHKMPMAAPGEEERTALREVFLKWQGEVRAKYYG